MRKSGALERAGELLLGSTRHLRAALLRLTTTSAVSSAFLNNTPIVATGIPTVLAWARRREDVTPSKLLIPLSYASIVGGLRGPLAVLAAVLFAGSILTELITNNAASALLFSVAISVAGSLGVDPRPFVIAVTVAASISLATPLGYQTNLMVYGPGGYRFADFVKVGVPLQILVGVVAVLLIPVLWPF